MTPFRLEPACKDYLWGGTKLKELFGKQSEGEILAETWELSAHPDGPSVIATGQYGGTSFARYLAEHPRSVGTKGLGKGEFPLLVKLIDAKQDLSVQVHPDDAYAARVENGLGKTEMWVVLQAEPDAFLYCGFDRELELEEFRRRIADNTLTEVLGKVPVSPGDVIFIPAGTIHAIGAGILLAEIQQNSNTTYRVSDFGRRDKDGNLRPLHVDKALEVTDRRAGVPPVPGAAPAVAVEGGTLARLAGCGYFTVEELRLEGTYTGAVEEDSFLSILCVEGEGILHSVGEALPFGKGDSLFLPAGCGLYRLESSHAQLLLATL